MLTAFRVHSTSSRNYFHVHFENIFYNAYQHSFRILQQYSWSGHSCHGLLLTFMVLAQISSIYNCAIPIFFIMFFFFGGVMDQVYLGKSTTHPKFNPTGAQTHDHLAISDFLQWYNLRPIAILAQLLAHLFRM